MTVDADKPVMSIAMSADYLDYSVLTVVAPELTVNKTVTTSRRLYTGQPITYTLTFANSGDAAASNVLVTDTLPGAVSGSNLRATLALSAGKSPQQHPGNQQTSHHRRFRSHRHRQRRFGS